MAVQNSGAKSLQEYLKRYESNDDKENKKKTKKIKKAKPDRPGGVRVFDQDPVWQRPVKLDEEENHDSADEERPQVDEDIDVKRMKRLEQLRLRRGYNTIAEDGSGWVSLSCKGENVGDQNSDISPPRRQRTDYTPSPGTGQRGSDADRKGDDMSPPQQRRVRHYTPSPEPHDRSVHTNSPPCKTKARNDTPSPSPSMKDTDLSPPRKKNPRNDSPPDLSIEDTDMSPPRQRQRQHYTQSPEDGQDSDMSPPRRSHPQKSGSSVRMKFEALDAHTSPGLDLSPPRKSELAALPPPRLPRRTSSVVDVNSHAYPDKETSETRKNRKDLLGETSFKEQPKTGLVTAHDIQEEISKRKKNDLLRFEQMDPSISGRGAEPIYRDKKGQRISKEEYLKSKQKVEEKPKEKKLEWGKGLAQKREAEARLQELELEKDKPFARMRDDPELDKMLKEQLRWGDPMAHLVKKKHYEPVLDDLGVNEKMKESGFIVPQEIPNHSWIKRRLDAAPNRYGIKPGRHWDGVDRSNGFEKKMFQRLNEKRATERESYLWSVSDM